MHLKSFLYLMLTALTLASCAQQPDKNKEIDLVMPRGTDRERATAADSSHSIDLRRNEAVLTLDGQKQTVTYPMLEIFFQKNRDLLGKKQLALLTGAGTPYKTVVDVLDLLTIHKIERYKIFTAQDDEVHQ